MGYRYQDHEKQYRQSCLYQRNFSGSIQGQVFSCRHYLTRQVWQHQNNGLFDRCSGAQPSQPHSTML